MNPVPQSSAGAAALSGPPAPSAVLDDPWARLDLLPRRVSLTPEEIRAAFQKAAAACHPDSAATPEEKTERTASFAALNEASAVLSSLPRRLQCLLTLEAPALMPLPAMDDTLLRLFGQTGAAVNTAAQLAGKKQRATTFLGKAALTAEEFQVQESLEAASAAVKAELDHFQRHLVQVDEARQGGTSAAEALGAAAHRAAFLEKWQSQLQAAYAGLI